MSYLDSNLRSTCVKMPIDKNIGKSKGFAFLKAPQHVSDELIKLNGFEFQKQSARIENAQTSRQKQGYNNRDFSNQHLFIRNVIPGKKTYAKTMS